MRHHCCLLLSALCPLLAAEAATVEGYLVDVQSRVVSPTLSFTPQSTPLADGSSTVLDVAQTVQADTNGFFSISLFGGRYNVGFGPYSKTVRILVPPDDTNTYAFNAVAALATNVGTFSWTNAFQVGVASGTNIVLTTNLAGLVTIHSPGWGDALLAGNNTFTGTNVFEDELEADRILAGTVTADYIIGDCSGATNLNLPEILAPAPTGVAATDTANLQAALNSTTNGIGILQYGGRGTVRLQGGQYALNDTLLVPMHMSVVGEGIERTRLYMTANNKPALKISGTCNSYGGTNNNWFSTYRGFSLRKAIAPWTSCTAAALDFQTAIDASQQLSRAVVEDVLVYGWFYGVRVRHSVGVTYRRVEAYGCNHSFYVEKGDSQVFINCFGGDALHSTYYTNLFSTNYSTAWSFRSLPGLGSFGAIIIGGESRRCNTAVYANTGNIQINGLNIEVMPSGPVFHFDSGTLSAVILNACFNNQIATNAHPLFKFAATVGNNSFIGPGTMTSANAYPEIELAGATDTIRYLGGGALQVTNLSAGTVYTLPLPDLTVGTNTLGPTVFTGTVTGNGGGLTNLTASNLTGTLPTNTFPAVVPSCTVDGGVTATAVIADAFIGDFSGATNLNASELRVGTVPLPRLPGLVVTNESATADAMAIGLNSGASASGALALGMEVQATGVDSVAIGAMTYATAWDAAAFGAGAIAGHASSVALGAAAQTTEADQIRLGTASHTVSVPGALSVTGTVTGNGAGLTNLTASGLPATNLWPSLHLPAEVTAVVGDELQLFTRGVAQANDPYTWPLQWVSSVGYPYPRYWTFTPSAGYVGTQTLTLKVLDHAQRTLANATSHVVVVSPVKSPATNVAILCLGDSLTTSGLWPAEAYRRLTQSGGTPAGHSFTNFQFVGEKPMTSYMSNRFTAISGATWEMYNGTRYTTNGHVLTCASGVTPQDVGSSWVDASNQVWNIVWAEAGLPEMIVNGGFESATLPNTFTNWGRQCNATATNWVEQSIVAGGTNSVGMLQDGAHWYVPALYQNYTVTPGTNYIVQGLTRGDGTNSALFALFDITHTNYIIWDTLCGNPSTNWVCWTTNFVAPSGCVSVRVYLACQKAVGAVCYWDNVSFQQATNAMKVSGMSSTLATPPGRLTHVSGAAHTNPIAFSASSTEPWSPLWNAQTNAIRFAPTLQRSGASNIAAAYILLGWNNTQTDHATISNTIRSLLLTLRAEHPEALVRLVGLQVPSPTGGLGANYGASAEWGEYTAVCARMRAINDLYQTLADSAEYNSYVRYLDVASQFDSEYNMPSSATPVNSRNTTTELRGNNGVHPSASGYYQIADVVYRDLIRTFCQ